MDLWDCFCAPSLPAEVYGDYEVHCVECQMLIVGQDDVYAYDLEHYCEECIQPIIEAIMEKAISFAIKNCKLTSLLPRYYPEYEYRCTPEEYEAGDRESYTESAHFCYCRHNCTNYEKLIRDLQRDDLEDEIYYAAIRSRIDELVEQAIENEYFKEDEDGAQADYLNDEGDE